MPKLPATVSKPPLDFDSPLRRTTAAPAAPAPQLVVSEAAVEAQHEAHVIAIAPAPRDDSPRPSADRKPPEPRISIRVDDATMRALEDERCARRVAGDKTNVSDIAGAILANWAKHRNARERS